jgi:hypothetical protein
MNFRKMLGAVFCIVCLPIGMIQGMKLVRNDDQLRRDKLRRSLQGDLSLYHPKGVNIIT